MKKFSFKATPKMKKIMQPMQIPAKFFFSSYDCFSFTDVHAMYLDFHHFFHEHVQFY